jgi:hypothetical protein
LKGIQVESNTGTDLPTGRPCVVEISRLLARVSIYERTALWQLFVEVNDYETVGK